MPDLIEFESLKDKSPAERLTHAFEVGESHFGVQQLLEAEGKNLFYLLYCNKFVK